MDKANYTSLVGRPATMVTLDDLTSDFLAELDISANVMFDGVAFRLDYRLPDDEKATMSTSI